MTAKYLQYTVMGGTRVIKYCAMAKRNHILICKVTEERHLNPEEMVYLYIIISQNMPRFGGYKNWILLQDLDTQKRGISSQIQKKN